MLIWLGGVCFVIAPLMVGAILAWFVYVEHRSDRVPVLLYHRLISRAAADRGDVLDDEMIWASYDTNFGEQMDYLAGAGYTTLDMDDYLAIREGRQEMPERPVILTFDDGYLSNYRYGYPAIKRNGLKAVIFVPLEPDEHTREITAKYKDDFLTAEQMRELSDNGVSIQSHTLTHCVLTDLDDDAAMFELTESRRRLAEITGKSVDHLAIPRAGYNRRLVRLVGEAGYRTACCNRKGSATGLSDLLGLPRVVVERDMSIEDFARSLRPKTAVMLRVIGNLKRIPILLGGSHGAGALRKLLYSDALRPIFRTANLKRLVAVFALLYAGGALAFVWYLLRGGLS